MFTPCEKFIVIIALGHYAEELYLLTFTKFFVSLQKTKKAGEIGFILSKLTVSSCVEQGLTCGLVVLNYVDFAMTRKLLEIVKDFPEIDHIAVIDNKSPNESYKILKEYENDKITVIQSEKNGGYSYGNNIGVRYLIENFNPDIIGIANPDTIFSNFFVRRIKELFIANEDYAVITGFQLDADNKTGNHPFWEDTSKVSTTLYPMIHFVFISTFENIFRRIFRMKHVHNDIHMVYNERYRDYCEKIRNSPTPLNQVWAVEGSLFFIRTKDFEDVGLFDEKIFLYFEEDVLAKKLALLGRKVGVANDITYIHDHKVQPENVGSLELTKGDKAKIFYFNNYVSDSLILQKLLVFLMKAEKFKIVASPRTKTVIKSVIRKLIFRKK